MAFRFATSDSDSEPDELLLEILRCRRSSPPRGSELNHRSQISSTTRDNQTSSRPNRIYELFVGNLTYDITEEQIKDELEVLMVIKFGLDFELEVNELIKPQRGRPFAFVRCPNPRYFEALLRFNNVSIFKTLN